MSRPVRWTRRALAEVREQAEFIALDKPLTALRVVERINSFAGALGDFPVGRRGRVSGTYEAIIPDLPFVLVFRLRTEAGVESVRMLRVIHMARKWPPGHWPK